MIYQHVKGFKYHHFIDKFLVSVGRNFPLAPSILNKNSSNLKENIRLLWPNNKPLKKTSMIVLTVANGIFNNDGVSDEDVKDIIKEHYRKHLRDEMNYLRWLLDQTIIFCAL